MSQRDDAHDEQDDDAREACTPCREPPCDDASLRVCPPTLDETDVPRGQDRFFVVRARRVPGRMPQYLPLAGPFDDVLDARAACHAALGRADGVVRQRGWTLICYFKKLSGAERAAILRHFGVAVRGAPLASDDG